MSQQHFDFTQPRRLDPSGFAISALTGIGRFFRASWFFMIYFLVKYGSLLFTGQFWAAIFGLIVLVLGIAYLRHRYFNYYADEERGEFVVTHGIFNKAKTVIKFDNILQVKIKQDVIQQALDLYGVEIDSAGSKESEADLYALDEQTALSLKQYLSDKYLDRQPETAIENTDPAGINTSSPEDTVFQIPNGRILLVSLFSNYGQGLGLFLAFVLTLLGSMQEFINISAIEDWYYDFGQQLLGVLYTIAIALVIVVLIPFVINFVRYFITYYNFALRRNERGNVFMHFGLFHIKDIILSRSKVQSLAFTSNPILRLLDLSVVSLKQVFTGDVKAESNVIVMPGMDKLSSNQLLHVLFDQSVYEGLSETKPKLGLFISRVIKSLVMLSVLYIPLFFTPIQTEMLAVFGVVFLLVTIYNILYFQKYRLLVSDDFLVKRQGVWDRDDDIVPIDKIMTVEVSQTIFQKLSDSANLEISTSAGPISVHFFDKESMGHLSNRLLYRIEK